MGRPRKYPERDILIATDTGVWISPEGVHYDFWKDVTRVRVGHPLAEAMKDSFKPLDVHYDIEQMTAAPGETRGE
jgi:hypothetical protein